MLVLEIGLVWTYLLLLHKGAHPDGLDAVCVVDVVADVDLCEVERYDEGCKCRR